MGWNRIHFNSLTVSDLGTSELRYQDLHCRRKAKRLEDNFTLIGDFFGLPENSS